MDQTIGSLLDAGIAWVMAEEWRLLVALVLFVTLVAMSVSARIEGRKRRSPCRWTRVSREATFDKWVCKTCGADALVSNADGAPGCNRGLSGL